MKFILSFLLAIFAVDVAHSQGGMGPGPGMAHSVAAVYSGPGDVSGVTAISACLLHAYTNASIGTNAVQLKRQSDSVTQDFPTITGGGLDSAAITTFAGGSNLHVSICYDQSGNGKNWTCPGAFDCPQFILSGPTSKPVMRSPNGYSNYGYLTQTTLSQSQPYTLSYTARRTADFTTEQYAYGDVNVSVVLGGWRNVADTAFMSSGTANRNASDAQDNGVTSDLHAFSAVFDNAGSSYLFVNSTSNAVASSGTNAIGASFGIMAALGQGAMTGDQTGLIIWPGNRSATAAAINGTSCTFMGFTC